MTKQDSVNHILKINVHHGENFNLNSCNKCKDKNQVLWERLHLLPHSWHLKNEITNLHRKQWLQFICLDTVCVIGATQITKVHIDFAKRVQIYIYIPLFFIKTDNLLRISAKRRILFAQYSLHLYQMRCFFQIKDTFSQT